MSSVLAPQTEDGKAESLDAGARIGACMVKAGLLSERDLQYALRVREKMGKDYPLTRVLQELGKLDDEKLRKVQKQSCLSLPLGDMLVELGHLKPQELRAASAMLKTPEWQGRQLAELLVAQQMIPEHVLLKVMADKLGYPVVQLNEHEVDKSLLDQVSLEWCRRHQVMPVKNTEEGVQVAFADPADKGVLQAAEVAFDRQISPAIVSRQSLEKFFTRYER